MSALSIQVPFPVFQDRDGQPLDNGYVWLGTSSLNPQTNPVVAYYDSALTIVATQPLRTLNGFISRAGSPAQVYVDAVNFSILVQDRQGTTVFSVPEGTGISPNASGVVYDPAGTGSVATTVQTKLRESVSVKDFGADPTGVSNSTTAIQAAITYAGISGGLVIFPAGTYKVTSQITIQNDKVFIEGAGQGATYIDFEPTANAVCFLVDKGSTVCYQGGICGISFYSNDTTYTKTAIKLVDTSGYIVKECGTNYPHWLGNSSIFLGIYGREAGSVSDIYAKTNRPLVIGPIPAPHSASGIGIDHFNFHNIYFIADSNPVVEMLTGLLLTQVSFTGFQAWVGGTYGLYWNDTTTATISNGLVLENIRFEQTSDATKHLVYIAHNTALQGLSIIGGQGGDRNGFYLRKVLKVLFESFYYTSATLEALNADTTVDEISMVNCFWQAGSTSGLTGHDLVYSSPKNPNTGAFAPNAAYCLTSNGAQMAAGRTYTATLVRNSFTEVLGGGAITSTGTYVLIGKLCFFQINIVCTGGATIASTGDTSYISGFPAVANGGVCSAVRYDNTTSLGNGAVSGGGNVSTPTWTAVANALYIISGTYLTT